MDWRTFLKAYFFKSNLRSQQSIWKWKIAIPIALFHLLFIPPLTLAQSSVDLQSDFLQFEFDQNPDFLFEPRGEARDLTESGIQARREAPSTPLEAGIAGIIDRTIVGYASALRGNLEPLQALRSQLLVSVIPLAEQSFSSTQGSALSQVSDRSNQIVTGAIGQLLSQLQILSNRIATLHTFFTRLEDSRTQGGQSALNPDEILSRVEAEQLVSNLGVAIAAYNQIVLQATPTELQALSQNQEFVSLGNQLKQLSDALVQLGSRSAEN